MKKNPKQLVAIIALVSIIVLIVTYFISAFFATPGEAGNRFFGLFFAIIALPIIAWIIIFCIGRMQNKHSIAEFFPESNINDSNQDINSK